MDPSSLELRVMTTQPIKMVEKTEVKIVDVSVLLLEPMDKLEARKRVKRKVVRNWKN